MTQPNTRPAVAHGGVQSGLSDDAPAIALSPACTPEAVLTKLRALVNGQHAELPSTETFAEDARAHQAGRNDAVRHAAAIGATSDGADLELLVRDALRAFQFGGAPGISITGPGVLLRPAAARLLTLVFHELTTNAIKFGALGGAGARQSLQIAWKHTTLGVEVAWRERGVAILAPADHPRSGFGRKLIETIFASYSGIHSSFRLLPGGAECSFTIPAQALMY
ncbi:sensor histidine kinase [Sphingomonas sp. ABOLE]|uniref:sensor histidine kinase n=1 Tax=Sphingomonas sp. ABOLE TaxID=1985878 RepID=UPI000F7D85CD|nr:sensor histidine kinase [Sphingomonas sp. ABOLE]